MKFNAHNIYKIKDVPVLKYEPRYEDHLLN